MNIVSCLLLLIASWSVEGIELKTKMGAITGFDQRSTKGRPFYQFNTIPFAKVPIGKLRLQKPEPADPWQGILNGTRHMPECPQFELLHFMSTNEVQYMGQEDCLYLSISVPKKALDENKKFPVMVYIHGGAFVGGSGNEFSGHELLNEDIVYVTINYRLGPLGFLTTEDNVIPGNLGLRDQTMALQWVKENIKDYGGKNDQVTIFGLSAGGASVHYHVLSPYSRGLFQRAALQSGTMIAPWSYAQGHRTSALQMGARLGCIPSSATGERLSRELLECLQTLDAKAMIVTSEEFMKWLFVPMNFSPIVDGDSLPDYPQNLLRDQTFANVDLIVGTTSHEGAFWTNSIYSNKVAKEEIENNFDKYGPMSLLMYYEERSVELSKKIFKDYLGDIHAIHKVDNLTDMFSDCAFVAPGDQTARFHAKSKKNKVYSYQLDYRGTRSINDFYNHDFSKNWVTHGDEIFYQFPMESFGERSTDINDGKVRDLVIKLWVNFAYYGNPTPDDTLGFKWLPTSFESPNHLSINDPPVMQKDLRKNMREYWASLPTHGNRLLFGKTSDFANKVEL